MNSDRGTPRARAARESSRSSSGSKAIVVAFFLIWTHILIKQRFEKPVRVYRSPESRVTTRAPIDLSETGRRPSLATFRE